jgi:hypothetical protein
VLTGHCVMPQAITCCFIVSSNAISHRRTLSALVALHLFRHARRSGFPTAKKKRKSRHRLVRVATV